MTKTYVLIGLDSDLALLVKRKFSSKKQLSTIINDILKNMIEFENPEERKVIEEIELLEKNILSMRSEKAIKETVLESIYKKRDEQEEKEKQERFNRARMMNNSIKASGVLRDWGQD